MILLNFTVSLLIVFLKIGISLEKRDIISNALTYSYFIFPSIFPGDSGLLLPVQGVVVLHAGHGVVLCVAHVPGPGGEDRSQLPPLLLPYLQFCRRLPVLCKIKKLENFVSIFF